MVNLENVKDGIAFCNKHIARLDVLIADYESQGKHELANKLRFQLVKWMEQLQHYMRQNWQEGGTTEDLTKTLPKKKKRFESA